MNNCIFCKIVSGSKSWTIYEDELIKAFLDINPASIGHTLIVPKRHCKDITKATDAELARMHQIAKKLVVVYKKALKCEGFNVISSNGRAAQQEIFHYHMHLIPRNKNDKLNIYYKPQSISQKDFKNLLIKLKKSIF